MKGLHPYRRAPIRAWRTRASKWHPGEPHHEVTCCYEEWLLAQSRRERKRISRGRAHAR